MPVNEPSHAHGQGYSDMNFLIAELAGGIAFTKGPYFADAGDFSSVGGVHTQLVDRLDDQFTATAGTLNYQRLFASAGHAAGSGTLLGAMELAHYDRP
jgi:hypothetical protein